jgi:hypothetical protein
MNFCASQEGYGTVTIYSMVRRKVRGLLPRFFGQMKHAQAFFPRAAEPLAGEDVFRGFIPRKTDGGN